MKVLGFGLSWAGAFAVREIRLLGVFTKSPRNCEGIFMVKMPDELGLCFRNKIKKGGYGLANYEEKAF